MRKLLLGLVTLALLTSNAFGIALVHSKWVNGNLVYYDATYPQRWYDAIGPTVVKYIEEFIVVPNGADNADPMGWSIAVLTGDAGTSTFTAGTTKNGELVIGVDATENDGTNVCITGEAWMLEDDMPLYFGIRLAPVDADQSDLIVGLTITDAEMWGGLSDGVYFESADETAVLTFTTEKSSTESEDLAAGTLTDAYHILEFYWDGATYVHAYFDNTLVASLSTNIPDDEALTFSLEILTGEAVANGVSIDWIRIIQCR